VAELYSKPADGSGAGERLVAGKHHLQPYSWSADGRLLAYHEGFGNETGFDIHVLPVGRDGNPHSFVTANSREVQPALSPDGRWLVYASDASGRWEILLRPIPGPGRITQVSTAGGYEPLWSPDGRQIYYRNRLGNRMRAVSFRSDGNIPILGEPQELFQGRFVSGGEPASQRGRMYDLSPDGTRFLMVQQGEAPPRATEYRVVVNWFEELRRLAPVND
jgi:serine/threonine-protein kinase